MAVRLNGQCPGLEKCGEHPLGYQDRPWLLLGHGGDTVQTESHTNTHIVQQSPEINGSPKLHLESISPWA